jgi:hypothetical protein
MPMPIMTSGSAATFLTRSVETTLVALVLALAITVSVLSLAAERAAALWHVAIAAPATFETSLGAALEQSRDFLLTARNRWFR